MQQHLLRSHGAATWLLVGIALVVMIGMIGYPPDVRADGADGEPDQSAQPEPQQKDQSEADEVATNADAEQGEKAPPRVIVRADRFTTIKGHIEYEDDNAIVVRDLNDKVHSLVKSRLRRIIDLVDVHEEGRRGRVILNNGNVRKGLILADGFDQVVMRIKGIRTELPREIVDRVELQPRFQDRYENFKAGIQPGQHNEHLQLIRWLIDNRRYELAKKELKALLQQTEMEEARRLLRMVNAQLKLMRSSKDQADSSDAPSETSTSSGSAKAQQTGPTRWLTREEVNLIRVYEMDFRDPPKMRIRPETKHKLIDQHATDPRIPASRSGRKQLLRAEPEQVAQLMFRVRARDLYNEIEVLSEPKALDLFRQKVHDAWLINNCSTRHCHGGPEAGAFRLHRQHSRDSRVAFANLLILERLELDRKWPLINYDKPEMSLIIQHGLPRQYARLPHPDVPGWKPVFRSADSRALKSTRKWIQAMMRPRPEYPVEFDPNRSPGEHESSENDPEQAERAPR